MNNRERSEIFARYVGLQLKGTIVARAATAKQVAAGIGRADANLNRWLNGKTEIPVSVLCEVCEFLGVDPSTVVQHAYDRMVFENGEPGESQEQNVIHHNFGVGTPVQDEPDMKQPPQGVLPTAARKGRRKADEAPYAE